MSDCLPREYFLPRNLDLESYHRGPYGKGWLSAKTHSAKLHKIELEIKEKRHIHTVQFAKQSFRHMLWVLYARCPLQRDC